MIIKFIKRIIRTIVAACRINWIKLLKLHHSNTDVVVWIVKPSLTYLGSDSFVKDTGLIYGLIKENVPFKIIFGLRAAGKLYDKTIFYTLSDSYNVFGFANYVSVLQHITKELEAQGNTIFPSSYEAAFWENKTFMHQKFKALNISEPQTILYTQPEQLINQPPAFPFLIKAEHACSSNGLFKIENAEQLKNLLLQSNFLRENKCIIVQQLINMRKDFRVIIVGDEIVLHYWRINTKDEWQPTSTSYGSKVDFDFFPEQWRAHILNTFKQLNLTTGAFDITWQNDDLNTEPLYLEVSPVYQPNPVIKNTPRHYAYYKKGITFNPSWDAAFVKIVHEIKHKEVVASLKKMNKIMK